VLGALLILASGGTASAAGVDTRFDGYCDGLHLEVPSAGLGADFTVDGYQTGCVSGGVFGTAKGESVGAGAQFVTIPEFETHTIINKNATWVHYGLTFPVALRRHWEVSRLYGKFAPPVGYLLDEQGVIASDMAVGRAEIQPLLARVPARTREEVVSL
jgi:hypothetical protein